MGQLTFYLEKSRDGYRLPELCDDSWILFCKFMDPRENTLSYLGSITLRKSCTVFELETKARGLMQWPRDAKSEVVVQKDDLCPTGVGRLVTLENVSAEAFVCGICHVESFLERFAQWRCFLAVWTATVF